MVFGSRFFLCGEMTDLALCGVSLIFPSCNKLVNDFPWFAFSVFSRLGVMTLRGRHGAEVYQSLFELISLYIHDRQETKDNQIQ